MAYLRGYRWSGYLSLEVARRVTELALSAVGEHYGGVSAGRGGDEPEASETRGHGPYCGLAEEAE